jgi:cell wall-associated NlpC family hydrolase
MFKNQICDSEKKIICIKNYTYISNNNTIIPIPFGSELNTELIINQSIRFNSRDFIEPNINQINRLNVYLKKWIGVPYLWGGKSTWGTDCSGFVQTIFKTLDILLPRDAYQQAESGTKINLSEIKKGDLAFFKNKEDKIVHVGIILNSKNKANIIHASGMVRIDKLDERGIFNEDLSNYSHELAFIKRII